MGPNVPVRNESTKYIFDRKGFEVYIFFHYKERGSVDQ